MVGLYIEASLSKGLRAAEMSGFFVQAGVSLLQVWITR